MNIKLIILITGIIMALSFVGCQKPEPSDIKINTEGMIVLGEKLDNPYTVDNMNRAYINLKSFNPDIPDISIKTTHLYIRFKPGNYDEMETLFDDTSLKLSEIPYDYDIAFDGYYYHDPLLHNSSYTWLYTVVEKDKPLPDIYHEILADLSLPPATEELKSTFDDQLIEFYDRLEHEALKITGNLDDDPEIKFTKANSWQPGGRITLWDDVAQDYIPIEHVVVKARRWFRTISGITDADGNFVCNGNFKRPANYKIVWKRYQFSVNTNKNRMFQDEGTGEGPIFSILWGIGSKRTMIKGPKKKGDWNLYLLKGSESHFHASIFRAAAQYYYGEIYGLKRPPLNSTWKSKMRIIANYNQSPELNTTEFSQHARYSPGYRNFIDPAWIEIYNTKLKTEGTFGLVIYQLAHASLWENNRETYDTDNVLLCSSWNVGVEVFLTRKFYPAYSATYSRKSVTGIIEDMLDGFKTTSSNFQLGYNFSYLEYEDQVSGYTIKQIEDALHNTTTINGWKENLKEFYDNETEDNLDAAFDYWFIY